ncbi:glycosyltransferase family 39 protein [Candidatus Sumerlaeota bacterium]|nr:glycosyltransferase family 39 protein [Candidatus Sumerlaeota bacterium]
MSQDAITTDSPSRAKGRTFDKRILPFLVILTVLAFYLRAWDADFGLPALYHPDEGRKVILFTDVASGRIQGNFSHPPLMINFVALVFFAAQHLQWLSDWNLTLFDQQLLLGRLVSAFIGAMTVIPVFLLARNLYGLTAGFVAGLAICVAPMHVLNSHYLKEEVYLAFFVVLSALFYVKWIAHRKKNPLNLWYFLSVVSSAAALSSKYIGVVMVLAFLSVLLVYVKPWKEKLKLSLLAVALTILTFLILCPQLFLSFGDFMRDLNYEAAHGTTGADRETLYFWEKGDRGLFFLREGILWGIGWPIFVTAALAVVLFFVQRSRHRSILVVAGLAIAWYVVAELTPAKRGIGRDRYVLSVLPLLAVLSGGFVYYIRRLSVPGARWWRVLFGIALVIPSSWMTWEAIRSMTPDTRELAQNFFDKYLSDDDFRVVHYGGYDPISHKKARISPRSPRSSTWEGTVERLGESRFVAMSSFGLARYEKFPDHEPDVIAQLKYIREHFPYVALFKADPWQSHEFHNPVIEIRSKKSREGYLYDGADPELKKRSEADQLKWRASHKKKEFEEWKKEQKDKKRKKKEHSERMDEE